MLYMTFLDYSNVDLRNAMTTNCRGLRRKRFVEIILVISWYLV